MAVVGFADNTNLISYGPDITENYKVLQYAFAVCERWAATRGMAFAPEKSELMHFTRAHNAATTPVHLGNTEVYPVESARFLGVWLDRKLRWTRHLKELETKLSRQQFALTKIAISVWEYNLVRAKEVYTKVVYSALAYGASAWHTPSRTAARGPVRCLRKV